MAQWKVVKIEDIKRIASKLSTLKDQLIAKEQEFSTTSLMFEIVCTDRTTYESESIEIFNDDNILRFKNVESVGFKLVNYQDDYRIQINISALNKKVHLNVSSKDREWVIANFSIFKEFIDEMENQNNWFLKNRKIYYHLIALISGYSLYSLITIILNFILPPAPAQKIEPNDFYLIIKWLLEANSIAVLIFKVLYFWSMGLWISNAINNLVLKLWPIIEIDLGLEHNQPHKKYRNYLYIVSSLVIIPIIINSFFAYFTK